MTRLRLLHSIRIARKDGSGADEVHAVTDDMVTSITREEHGCRVLAGNVETFVPWSQVRSLERTSIAAAEVFEDKPSKRGPGRPPKAPPAAS